RVRRLGLERAEPAGAGRHCPPRQRGAPEYPGLTPVNPGLTPVNPGLTPVNPGLTPVNPGLTPVNPGLTPVNPGLTPGAMRHRKHLLRSPDRGLRPARLRERAAAHVFPAAAVRVRRDPGLAHPAGAARAGVSSERRPRRRNARARSRG